MGMIAKLCGFPFLNNADYVFQGLLAHGFFSEKIIPIFTSDNFYKFVLSDAGTSFCSNNINTKYGYISQRALSNKSKIRKYSIPHPKAYFTICKHIRDNWGKISALINRRWIGGTCNLGCVRKINNSNKIFEMNYASRTNFAAFEYLNISIGKRFLVETDIANFFPSIYTHSIAWSIVGRKNAFRMKNNKKWFNILDFYIRNSQNEESNGIHIGPHSSNLISDMLLSKVDNALLQKGFTFTRYIDDYKCYTKTRDEASLFIVTLADLLNELRLGLNANKTRIRELPCCINSSWTRELRTYNFKKRNQQNRILIDDGSIHEMSDFFDHAISLEIQENNSAVLNYAIKMLLGAKMSPKASQYFQKKASHLIFLFPYLAPLLPSVLKDCNDHIFNECIEYIFSNSLIAKEWSSASYALFTALKYKKKVDVLMNSMDEIISSQDCILIMALYLYSKENSVPTENLIDFAKEIVSLGLDDEYWVFIYELFKEKKLTKVKSNQEFGELRKGGVSFLV